ncbi:response regulator receiver modulated diguanylate cyclase/phosphodiesterase [Colwellia chukchiensis]|uniref:Response regulator receiver modulated diguanylate cyclase/phosphodiesterase n=1 Tax=Colwellia chukchiensis TaxID=641665 RepID=A0A1H7N4C9_9GAMM|nr:EAL domain-containing protein [Colwellia chukchiensis]SEL17707.1 response regulator receiver modulated diguanylate cyclase/phosphodiesterase [Colwellia chukchiensis]
MQASENTNDDFLFIDDSEEDELFDSAVTDTWKVLIVDDDPEIHSVTQLALSDLVVLGRHLEYIHAYSGQDACKLLEDHQDIVLVLLDVVMESDDAGLAVVKYIREQLKREDIRIVLRTGQPGYAPEESVIKDYDINDYKTKTELTRRKLVTTVYAAIRSYQQIDSVSKNRQGLEKIIGAAANLLELHTVHDYAHGVLAEMKKLVANSSGMFCARGQGIVEGADDLSLYILAQDGRTDAEVNQKLLALGDRSASQNITSCFQQKQHIITADSCSFYFVSGGFRAVIHLTLTQALSTIEMQHIEVFLTSIATGYENVHLFQKLRNAAYKDWLTELPNRLDFVNLLDKFCQSDDSELVSALIDINHFSDINDGLGQDVGNQLLMAVAARISHLSDQNQLARIGADVFGIIGPKKFVNPETLMNLFSRPFAAGEQNLPISACIGFCSKGSAGSRGLSVLNQINIALNLAKKSLHEPFAYYHQEMEDKTLWRLGMIRQLRTDFADNRLALWYQPQLSLATGKVIGAEALLRWQTVEGKFISPAVFIPLAEYSGLIIEIGNWVVEQACQQLSRLAASQFEGVSISVNVSIPQFKRDNFVDTIIEIIQRNQVDPSKLELEITENVLMDEPQVIIDALVRLKKQGISIALDDFGTGYSSLSYLQKLPLDRLKVDRSFVSDIAKKGGSIIADTIINLGQQMNLKVIAEGIENSEQEQQLKVLGCDEVQGFYYAKPMPVDDFFAFLEKVNRG